MNWKKTGLQGFAFSLMIWVALEWMHSNWIENLGIFAASFVGFSIVNYSWIEYKKEQTQRKLRNESLEFLLEANLFSENMSVEQMIYEFAKNENNLGKEFKQAQIELEKGNSVEQVLKNLKKRNGHSIERLIELMEWAQISKVSQKAFRLAAAQELEQKSVETEGKSIQWIQKYTILLAAAILVPGILGMMASTVHTLGNLNLNFLGIENSSGNQTEITQTAVQAAQAYIAVNALMCSYFLGIQEGQKKKWIIYALSTLPIAFTVFYWIQGGT
ncbi:MAG: hypothetical protein Q7S92_05730 [Candidatus Diapherotrites archaeon]|nr:hypothetical protein [Candidatus Diapherotrites archaeon]